MANLREALEEYERLYGEPIEAMVVGQHDDKRWDDEALNPDENVILTREAGLAKVDQEYDNSYGGADCYPLYAWTASRIFFVHEYDGSTGMVWVPRSPVALAPEFGGQSGFADFMIAQRKEEAAA